MKAVFIILCTILFTRTNAQDVFGYWKSVDGNKGFTTSIIVVYEYQKRVYGQIVVAYDEKTGVLIDTVDQPVQKAGKAKGKPFLLKISLFWNLEKKGAKYKGGMIFDPRSGMIVGCEIWLADGHLVIRGLVGPFGMNELFYPVNESDFPPSFVKPSLTDFVPVIP